MYNLKQLKLYPIKDIIIEKFDSGKSISEISKEIGEYEQAIIN